MGLFDFFKKKKREAVKFEIKTEMPTYNVWAQPTLPRNDNYAIAAFIAYSKNGAKVGKVNDDYPRYFSYDYRVNDPKKYHLNMINEGYLEKAEPDAALRNLKVDQLKEILARNGLSDKGKKDALVLRIMESVDTDSLNLETYYTPTAKGWEHLHKYEYIFSLKNYDIKAEQFEAFKKTCPEYMKPNDIIWKILNERYNQHVVASDYGLARCELLNQAKLLESENKNVDALAAYAAVMYYDTSGYANSGRIKKIDELFLAPAIIKKIFTLKEFYDDRILERCYSNYVPNRYVSKAKFRRLLQDIFDDKAIDIQNYL